MNIRNVRWGLMALGAAAAMTTMSAQAAWTFNSAGTAYSYSASVAGDPAVSLTGFYISNTNVGTSTWASAANVSATGGTNSAQGLVTHGAYGLGMYTGTDNGSPYHALDNNQNTEGVLLNFGGQNVTLNAIGLGYASNGTTSNCVVSTDTGCYKADTAAATVTVDMAVYRWVGGTGAPAAGTVAGQAGGTMTGWELVGVYGDMRTDSAPTYDKNIINTGNKTSSWWLITAYNSGLKGQSSTTASVDAANDYFKLLGVAGTKCTQTVDANGVCGGTGTGGQLPEPATLALTGVALAGVAGLRRRKVQAA